MSGASQEDTAFTGPGALADLIRRRELTPRELVELSLRRIESLNPQLAAFRVTRGEEALAEADELLAHPDKLASLPLAGVPFAAKDDLPLTGESTTRGSRSFAAPAGRDAEAIRRLRAAGAIPVGVTNVPELTIFPWTATEANGVTRNPWDLSRTPGGSSGGSAAAVAAGLVPTATASDGGGSIRIPAACCGLVGMKPTRGRVSTDPSPDNWLGLSVPGALTRTVADSALMLDVMTGNVPGDRDTLPPPTVPFATAAATEPGRLRIAVSAKLPPGLLGKLSPDQRGAWEQTRDLLTELGHEVTERDPDYGLASLQFTQTFVRGIYEDSLRVPDRRRLESSSRQMANAGKLLVPGWRKRRLLAGRAKTVASVMRLWTDFDVLMTPGLARAPLPAEGGFGKPAPLAFNLAASFTPWTAIFNLTGQPAVSLPAGFSAAGLPLSVQLVGRLGDEGLLYSLAAQLETARPWADRRPALAIAASA